MNLIVVTGLEHDLKRAVVARLAALFTAYGARVQIIDNADQALQLAYPTWRLPGGCACCTLAFGLIDGINRLECDYALVPVSGSAMPDVLALLLNSLRSAQRRVITLALISDALWARQPYLAGNLCSHADYTIASADELEAVIHALV